MEKRALFFCLLFFIPMGLFSQSRTTFKYGTVKTEFRNEDHEQISRKYYAIGREYFPSKNNSFYFSYALSYVRKAALLKNRSWKSGWDSYGNIYFADIKADVAFIELPIKFGYQNPFIFRRLYISFGAGFSISMPVEKHSKLYLDWSKVNVDTGDMKPNYWSVDEVEINATMNSIYSVALYYRFVGVEFQYSRALEGTEGFTGLSLKDYFDSYHFLMRFSF
jgi:hypothetical protein